MVSYLHCRQFSHSRQIAGRAVLSDSCSIKEKDSQQLNNLFDHSRPFELTSGTKCTCVDIVSCKFSFYRTGEFKARHTQGLMATVCLNYSLIKREFGKKQFTTTKMPCQVNMLCICVLVCLFICLRTWYVLLCWKLDCIRLFWYASCWLV